MISFKEGVECIDIIPLIFNAMVDTHTVFRNNGQDNLTITALRDGKHKVGSKHYQGRAFDCRTRTVEDPMVLARIIREVRATLGSDFDVILHPTHLHVEYDPK